MSAVSQQALLFSSGLGAATVSFEQFGNVSVIGPNVVTATAWNLGNPYPTRTIYALVSWNNATPINPAPWCPLTNVTINGVVANILVQTGGDIGSYIAGCAIVSAQVPNDPAGDVIMTFQPGASYYNVWIATYRAIGVTRPSTPTSTFASITLSSGTHTENLSVQKGGIVLSPMFLFWDTTSTVTGITRDYNVATGSFVVEGGNALIAADNASYPITATVSGATNFLMVGASFR